MHERDDGSQDKAETVTVATSILDISRERRDEAAKSALGSLPQRAAEAPGAYVSRVKTDPVQK